jgi:hypothetical protein
MTVNKGLLSLVENTPNFSNQALENAVNTLKVGWVIKSSSLDTDIQNNTVLTTSQKNDLKDDINNNQLGSPASASDSRSPRRARCVCARCVRSGRFRQRQQTLAWRVAFGGLSPKRPSPS